ncbi:TetR/AcrR family transcriptional regulator [Parvibaculum sp.]|uniref:TetR/AcrR family transcriptional regulator n=1 Tax=Parvibaculum sp. TaxID=2024848 RepID=UPI000C9153B7|nr:TetR/AcrR family transcriptional regulator [Parvibaculum sp.]MAB14944.1 hypothetical protein [Parvibaculum sp.]
MTDPASPAPLPARNRGRERMESVLLEAERMMIEEGYSGLTMRRLAERCGIALGNLQYYFPSKSALVAALADHICARHRQASETWPAQDAAPEAAFEALIRYVLDDIRKPEGSILYWEFWALAAHDDHAKTAMAELYQTELDLLSEAIARLTPALPETQIRHRAEIIVGMLEGSGLMIGPGRPHAETPGPLMEEIIAAALAVATRPA